MTQKNNGSPILVIIGISIIAVLFKTCQKDSSFRGQAIETAKNGVDFFAMIVGTILLVLGGGGAVLMLKEVLSSKAPVTEWGWRFVVAAGAGLFGLWVISHAS